MAIDPFRMSLAVVAQQGEVAGALLDHQHIAIGKDEQPARVRQPGDVWRGEKPCGTCDDWPLYGTINDLPVAIRPAFGAGSSAGSM